MKPHRDVIVTGAISFRQLGKCRRMTDSVVAQRTRMAGGVGWKKNKRREQQTPDRWKQVAAHWVSACVCVTSATFELDGGASRRETIAISSSGRACVCLFLFPKSKIHFWAVGTHTQQQQQERLHLLRVRICGKVPEVVQPGRDSYQFFSSSSSSSNWEKVATCYFSPFSLRRCAYLTTAVR